jgi:hypothetical protein
VAPSRGGSIPPAGTMISGRSRAGPRVSAFPFDAFGRDGLARIVGFPGYEIFTPHERILGMSRDGKK